MKLVWIFN